MYVCLIFSVVPTQFKQRSQKNSEMIKIREENMHIINTDLVIVIVV